RARGGLRPQMRTRKLTEEGVRRGLRWVVDIGDRDVRAARSSAFVFAFYGPTAFRDCSTVIDVCRQQGVSPRTFRHYLAELDGMGLRWVPIKSDLPHVSAPHASEEWEEEADSLPLAGHLCE